MLNQIVTAQLANEIKNLRHKHIKTKELRHKRKKQIIVKNWE